MTTQVSGFVASGRAFQAQIVAESLTLPERADLFREDPSRFELDESLSNTRMDRWRHTLGLDKDADPTRRAKSLGINPKDLPLILGKILPDENGATPSWWEICQEILDDDSDSTTSSFLKKVGKPKSNDSEEEGSEKQQERLIPFEDTLAPWVVVATRFLIQRCPDVNDILTDDILQKEQRGLLENLSIITRSVLLHDFEFRKTSSYDSNDLFLGLIVNNPPADVYSSFTSEILEDRWRSYIQEYPALARLMATRVELWVASLTEFAERVVADHDLIQEKFSPDSPLGKLVKGGRGVSDSHNGARAVVICKFENGCEIVYKPRSMSVDVAWTNFVEWFNRQFPDSNPMASMDVIDCGTYGWMAFASDKPCADLDEVRAYFNHMGMLLCAVHTLQGNDFHLENIIADGPMPIAIDLETISVPEPLSGAEEDNFTDQQAARIFSRSVLRTLLLPMVMSQGGPGGAHNLGAIGIEIDGNVAGGAKFRKVLSEINTDFMHWKLITDEKRILELEDPMLHRSKVKLADGTPVCPQDYLDDLIHGYQEAYHVIMKAKDELLSPTGPLNALASSWVRILNRSTNIYYRLILETCNQDVLRSGVNRWVAADRFCVGFEDSEENIAQESFSEVVAMEHEALLRGDVAYFITQGNSLSYATLDIHTGEPISTRHTALKTSAINAANSQLEAMSEDDLTLQVKFIDSSYLTALLSLNKMMHAIAGIKEADTESTEDAEQHPLSDAEIKSFVKSGLDALTSTMVEDDKSIQWIDLSSDSLTETARVSPMDSGIYSGRGGIACLFERAARVFSNPQYLEIARKCLNYEIRSVQRASNPMLAPSGMLTTPGIMLGFWRIGGHEGHGDLRDLTQKMISEFGQRAIDRDTTYDILAGSAGMILVLARIHDEEPLPGITDLVTKLGEHLLANSCDDHGGPSWKSTGSQALCGHSHGICGIALGLLHAYRLTGRADFKETALAAIECEHRMRSDEFGNWPDLRGVAIGQELDKSIYLMHAWCHGLPGIGLNRAACLQIEDSPTIRDDYEFCLANRIKEHYQRNHLCCGSSGFSEIRRSIGVLMNNENETAHARRILETCIHVLQNSDDTGLVGEGLMQGSSGVTWTALATIDSSDPNSHLMLAMP